ELPVAQALAHLEQHLVVGLAFDREHVFEPAIEHSQAVAVQRPVEELRQPDLDRRHLAVARRVDCDRQRVARGGPGPSGRLVSALLMALRANLRKPSFWHSVSTLLSISKGVPRSARTTTSVGSSSPFLTFLPASSSLSRASLPSFLTNVAGSCSLPYSITLPFL